MPHEDGRKRLNYTTCDRMQKYNIMPVTANVVPSSPILVSDYGGDMYLRNFGSYESHTA
jgi:hypothetical protein